MDPVSLPISTARLTLRLYDESDLPDLEAMYSRPDVVRYLYEEPFTAEDALAALKRKAGNTGIREEGFALTLVVVRTEDGAYIGDVSLWVVDAPNRGGEVGFVLHPDHQRRGYGAEATRAILDVAFGPLGLHRVIGRCDGRNAASAALMAALGMRREAEFVSNEYVKGEWTDELVYAVLEDEWPPRPAD